MDKIMKITLGAFIIILIGFISVVLLNVFMGNAYLASLSGTYIYNTTITTDSRLTNVTLFIPVPEDHDGNSLIIAEYSSGTVAGIPSGWTSTLFGTGKTTLIKITAPDITPPEGTNPGKPFTITISANVSSKNRIETLNPVMNGVIFRPVQNIREATCPPGSPAPTAPGECYEYETTIYADYLTSPNASVSISSNLEGKNSWKIFELQSNEYLTGINVAIAGENHGWVTAKGALTTGIGIYDKIRETV